ncbi:hypothetical protein [Rhizobium sp. 1399]|uniref:hypothetical protein n=1 Tax=Rhizobium sp. 1399 TaxID=2817758 RepID=UPI00285C898E|nr:hypothetical protein [Rhizobium sp. 1399]MDR6664007.1 hypothetical protein [Rhizobium sp. 1399]
MGTDYEEDVMPLLEINEDEIMTLLGALRTEMKDWDGRIQGAAPRKVEWIKRNIDKCSALRERLHHAACSTTGNESEEPLLVTEITEAEAKRLTAVANMIIAEIEVAESLKRMEDAESQSIFVPDPTKIPFASAVWHHKLGWIHPTTGA